MYEKIKKYWKFIVGFIASVFAVVFVYRVRDKRIERGLQLVNAELAESTRLIGELKYRNIELENQINESRNIVQRLEQEFKLGNGNIEEIERINSELGKQSEITNQGLRRLKEIIDKNTKGKQTT